MVTNTHVYTINKKKRALKRKNLITDIYGFTQSLIRESQNFIIHFRKVGDEELFSDR